MRLYLLDTGALGAWLHFAVSESSDHADLCEGVERWWHDFSGRFEPAAVVACFDCSRDSNWRTKLYPEYKSARLAKPKDEALIEGMRKLPEVFKRLGVPTMRVDGFEADDIIATLAAQHDDEVIIVTSDKDLMMLVDERVKLYDPRPNKAGECVFYDVAKVTEKMGVPPHRIRELLALMGDAADSVPGVEGWGKVRAVNAVNQTKSRFELVRKAQRGELRDISEKYQKALAANMKDFHLSYELVGLRFDVPIDTKEAA